MEKEYRELVLAKIEGNTNYIIAVDRKVNECRMDIATLKVKLAIISLVGGSIPTIIAAVIWYMKYAR